MSTEEHTTRPNEEERRQRLWEMVLNTAACSHDLANWLTTAMAALDLALLKQADLCKEVVLSRFALEQAQALLREALQGRGTLTETCDAAATVDLVVNVARIHLSNREHIELISEIHPTPPAAISPGDLQRVVLNLLLNAAAALPNGGRITITVRAEQDSMRLEVHDTGDGVVREHPDGGFEVAVHRVDGRGLGLPGSELLVKQAGGRLMLVRQLSGGTLATVIIPLSNGTSP